MSTNGGDNGWKTAKKSGKKPKPETMVAMQVVVGATSSWREDQEPKHNLSLATKVQHGDPTKGCDLKVLPPSERPSKQSIAQPGKGGKNVGGFLGSLNTCCFDPKHVSVGNKNPNYLGRKYKPKYKNSASA